MRTTIDAAGRLVVPMPLRRMLGFKPGVEVEVSAINGHLEVAIPSRVAVDEGPHGVRFVAEADEKLNARQVRDSWSRPGGRVRWLQLRRADRS